MRTLVHEYCRAPIVLYTGAGVSTGPPKPIKGKTFGLPTWFALLEKIAGEKLPRDPWDAADQAVKLSGNPERFEEKLKKLVESPDNYTRRYGQLSSTFVSNAPTLRAVAAFSGRLTGRIVSEKAKGKAHFRSASNPRLHAVVTSNYDCFLESAGSSIYRKSPLQPVTALGSSAASATRIPVFHIHGYVPHPFYHLEERQGAVDRLVITRQDYENVWNRKDVFGTTMGPQIHYLRYYTVLFVGFSFADEYVLRLLRHVHEDYLGHADRTHFALMTKEEARAKGDNFFAEIGVTPITYGRHDEIPEWLGRLYSAGLAADRILEGDQPTAPTRLPEVQTKSHQPTGRRYSYSHAAIWQIVQHSRNEGVGARFLDRLEEAP